MYYTKSPCEVPAFAVDCHFKMTAVIKTVVFIQPLIFR